MAAVTTIQPEIRICRQHDRIGEYFAHPDKTCIGEAHRHIRVLLHQVENAHDLHFKVESGDDRTIAKQRIQTWPAAHAHEMKGLGEHSLARGPWRRVVWRGRERPRVMPVATTEKRYQETRVNEGVCRHG